MEKSFGGMVFTQILETKVFYFTLFIYFASSDLDALKYGHSEGTGQMTSFEQREGWKR